MSSCFFSIVIPAYNYAQFLERAIRSVLDQQFHDCEIIVINDGSTDNTDALMKEILKECDPKLRYISQENRGLSAVRNLGVMHSNGAYLIFLDADDALLPDSLERTYEYLVDHPQTDLLICDYLAQMPDGREKLRSNNLLNDKKKDWFYYYIGNTMAMANGATIIRRTVFDEIRYCEDLRQAEDIPVFGQILANFHCALFLRPILRNFKHIESMRNQINFTPNIAYQLTNLLFDPEKLPSSLMKYKADFLAYQYFQLFRSYEKAMQYKLAIQCYRESLKASPWSLFNLGRHIKYIRCVFKFLFGSLVVSQR